MGELVVSAHPIPDRATITITNRHLDASCRIIAELLCHLLTAVVQNALVTFSARPLHLYTYSSTLRLWFLSSAQPHQHFLNLLIQSCEHIHAHCHASDKGAVQSFGRGRPFLAVFAMAASNVGSMKPKLR
jgi:hypothetical protein